MFEIILQEFKKIYGTDLNIEPTKFFAPGRVNLIGEHTDHEGGNVFPCAINLGIYALANLRPGNSVRLCSLNFDENKTPFEINFSDIKLQDSIKWVNYPLGVINILQNLGHKFNSGIDILYYGNLPDGAGLSSSAAIEVLTARIFNELYNLNLDGVDLAKISQRAENEFVGMHCGIMDQFAVSMGKKNNAVLLNCSSLKYSYAPLNLDSCKIIITNSNVQHSLAGSEYNLRREQCENALKDLQTVKNIKCLCDLTPEEFENLSGSIKNPESFKRAKHVIYENARTLNATEKLKAGDLKAFGKLMDESHISLRDYYQVTIFELDTLAELAWKIPGVYGSRMTGGGFGGCTVSIVDKNIIDEFKNSVGENYKKSTGRSASFYIVDTSDGANKIL